MTLQLMRLKSAPLLSRARIPKTPIIIWLAFFALYVFMGMLATYPLDSESHNFYYSADQARVFGDLTSIGGNHYRIKVHPLFLLIAQPAVHAANGLVAYWPLSALLVEAILGASSVVLFYGILASLKVREPVALTFAAMLGLSFSTMFFSSVTESFVFAEFSLIAFWRFVVTKVSSSSSLDSGDWAMVLLFGVLCFGVTLTNFFAFLIGLAVLAFSKLDHRRGAQTMAIISLLAVAVVVALCVAQRLAWRTAPLFWSSLIAGLADGSYEELEYLSFAMPPAEIASVLLPQFFAYPLVGAHGVLQYWPEFDITTLRFGDFPHAAYVALAVFALAAVIAMLPTRREKAEPFRRRVAAAMLCAYLVNLCLHVVYSPSSAFLYSPHYLFYLIALFCLLVDSIGPFKRRKAICLLVVIGIAFMAANNFCVMVESADFAMQVFSKHYSRKRAVLVTLLALAIAAPLLTWLAARLRHAGVDGERVAKVVAASYTVYSVAFAAFQAIEGAPW